MIGQEPKKKNIEGGKKSMADLRLQKDLAGFDEEKLKFVQIQFPSEEDIKQMIINIYPQSQSLYHGTRVSFSLKCPQSYPLQPPKLLCLNRILHPNINHKGNVCLPLVREDWTPTVTLSSIIHGLIFILTYPDGDDALEPQIGDILLKDQKLFKKIIQHTNQGRNFKNKQYDMIMMKLK